MKVRKKVIIYFLLMALWLILIRNSYIKYNIASFVQNLRFKIITRNMESKKYANLTLYNTGEVDKNYINNIRNYIKEGDNKLELIFGQTISYPLNIVIFETSEKFGKAFFVNPEHGKAVTSFNSIYFPVDNINHYIIIHEYTHYKMNSYIKEKEMQYREIPMWFKEGIAEYTSIDFKSNNRIITKLDKIKDFRELEKNNGMSSYQLEGYDTYMQSYLAIKKIVEIKGEEAIQDILINTKSMGFYDAFAKVVGLSIEDFQNLLK